MNGFTPELAEQLSSFLSLSSLVLTVFVIYTLGKFFIKLGKDVLGLKNKLKAGNEQPKVKDYGGY